MTTQITTFAAGCFWGVEEIFRMTPGVVATRVGYTGGAPSSHAPSYEAVCADQTSHAEAVEVTFNPSRVSYEKLLEIFWANHNPTTLNRQGPDVGSQYRSVIFYHTPEQRVAAEKSRDTLVARGAFSGRSIVTEIVAATQFFEAEEYHQKYFLKRGGGSCHV